MENIGHYWLTSSTVKEMITPEVREELKSALRDKLRQFTDNNVRIGYWDEDTQRFDVWNVEEVGFSVEHDVCGDAMDKVFVQYSLEFDTLSTEFCVHVLPFADGCDTCAMEWNTKVCSDCNKANLNCNCGPF